MTKRSGLTILELMVATAIMLMCLGLVAPMIRTTSNVWNQTSADSQNKELLSQAVLRMAPTVRNGLMVDVAHSNAHKLVFSLPAIDPVTKQFVFPLVSGDIYAFYLSDNTGSTSHSGTILWRSVNGVADRNWSIRSGVGRLDFGTSNLSFAFDSSTDPNFITVTVYSTQWVKNKPTSATATSTILLRNHQLAGL